MLRRVASYAPKPRVVAARFSSSRRPPPKATEDFLLGTNNAYLEQIYDQWKQGEEVDPAWASILNAVSPQGDFKNPVPKFPRMVTGGSSRGVPAAAGSATEQDVIDHMKVALLVRAYEARGHLTATLDPLGLYDADLSGEEPPELNPAYFGFTEADLDREFTLGYNGRSSGFTATGSKYKLRDLVQLLKKTYCGKIGWEIMHITDPEKQGFLRDRIQLKSEYETTKEYRQQLFRWLADAEWFERYLHKKYPTTKRFGLDGGESTVVGLKAVLERGSELGVQSVVIGMPHRGRLNVLANVVGKPLQAVLHEFEHHVPEDAKERLHQMEGSGDVKYHLGMSHDLKMSNGKTMHLSLVANPSHLEAVNPIAIGKTRAKQFYGKDEKREQNMTILLHGDAAFAGQGVCYETTGMSDLHAYTTGGTIHIVVNNQIGFTTDPYASRTQPYCTDLGKTIQAPIFHVNGDDPDAVARVCNLAMEYRQEFKKDVIVDLLCYRRFGHNELDNPHFTQPRMYAAIGKHPLVLNVYAEKLIKEGVLTKEERTNFEQAAQDRLAEAFKAAKDYLPKPADWLETVWQGFKGPRQLAMIKETKFGREFLTKIADAFLRVPEKFTIHPQLEPQLVKRTKSIIEGKDIDWASAELLAFGSLMLEGFHVRLSGQDVERGTFSQRHAVLHDRENGNVYIPLANVSKGQAEFSIHNSSLSEFGVLGFELGYSLENPNSLVMWEAQFGDFANGAQIIFDQFISAGEAKWLRQSGLTVLLPHGYDGQGPEHSSARLERFLQQVDEDEEMPTRDASTSEMTPEQYRERAIQKSNMQVTFCTAPSNHFHVLRRQIHREFRKPLICMVSKAHLRGPRNVSSIEEFTDGAFRPVIDDPESELAQAKDVRRVILCSGQVYFTLAAAREGKLKDPKNPAGEREPCKNTDVAIVRVEQLAPFPFFEVADVLRKYPNAEVMWCQEEHKNMGAWQYVQPRIKSILRSEGRSTAVKYVGRKPAAATATGLGHVHEVEKASIIEKAFA